MPRTLKLKVFRTSIGFHDAYVAAPSQKAAMEAWGSDKDLFARGEAELVTEEALTAEPLAKPGTVIKRLRGTMAEQIAALPPDKPRPAAGGKSAEPAPAAAARKQSRPTRQPKPRPSRAALDEAEAALAAAEADHDAARRDLAEREKALARQRRELDATYAAQADRLEAARRDAAERYEAALRKWRDPE
jgi:hypothetical protein